MKKLMTILLAAALALSLFGAGAAFAQESSPFAGSWKIYSMEGDMPVPHEQIAGTFMDSIAVTLGTDGRLSVNMFGEVVEDVWTDNGDGTGIFNINGYACQMTVRDGFLWVDMGAGMANSFYVFEKSDQSAEELAGSTVIDWNAVSEEYSYKPPEQEKIDSVLVGEWRFYSMEGSDPAGNVAHEALPALLDQGRDYAGVCTLSIGADGWYKISDFSGFEQNLWTCNGDNTGVIDVNGEACTLSVEDGLLALRASGGVTRYEKTAPIGTTGFHVVIPADYTEGAVTERERQDDLVAYYRSDSRLMDFDVYQFADEGRALDEYAALEAEEYGAAGIENVETNGIPLALYYSEEQYDDGVYRVANYIFDAGDDFGELSFWLDGDDAEALTAQIVGSLFKKQVQEDIHGFVVEKLPGDFIDRYSVRGDDGTLYEGEYIGFEKLEAGVEVTLSKRGMDWSIDPVDQRPSFSDAPTTPAGVYTTADGIVIDELGVELAGGRTWSFSYALHNPTDKTMYFDPSPFVLKTADGTEIKTAAPYVSADEIWANNVTRVSTTIMSPELLQLGDEISFWYDGTFLGTVTAREF